LFRVIAPEKNSIVEIDELQNGQSRMRYDVAPLVQRVVRLRRASEEKLKQTQNMFFLENGATENFQKSTLFS
jgi:hypothetical protein